MTDSLDHDSPGTINKGPDPDDTAKHSLATSDLLNQEAADTADDRPRQFARSIGKMARMMATDGALGTGALAELRRISPQKPFTPALWKLLLGLDESEPWGGLDRDIYERRMATLAMGMAFCAGLHNYKVPLGRALAEAGWSELRFVRLMEARGETLEKLIRRMSQFLASKSQSANWVDVGWLLIGQDWDSAEATRLRIARSYYGALYAQAQNE